MKTKKTLPLICLVEDDQIMGESLCDRFTLEGMDYHWHQTVAAAERALRATRYSLVICDIQLADDTGEALFKRYLPTVAVPLPFIFITGYGSVGAAVELLKLGAADYLIKPFDIDLLVEKMRGLLPDISNPFSPVAAVALKYGPSSSMQHIHALLPKLAAHRETVLITGESGVGKEMIAKDLHLLASGDTPRPFSAVNCGALTDSLIEAELFGHEKGAFTGALRAHKGYFEQAHNGTLFLDEIGELSLMAQVKLLRVIQERQVLRVGGETPIAVNFRLICATNVDLKKRVEEGRFREDLYYRIHVVNLRIIPLRERREDIPWLTHRFIDEFARSYDRPAMRLTAHAEQALLKYDWPGNVRELRHVIERACILASGSILDASDLFEDAVNVAIPEDIADESLQHHMQDYEKRHILQTLENHAWQIQRSALALGISRKTLWKKMVQFGLHNLSAHPPHHAASDPADEP